MVTSVVQATTRGLRDNPSNPTTFSGSFTFNCFALDNIPGDPQSGSYASVGGPFHFTLALGGLTFDFGGVSIRVLNNYPFPVGDQYQVLYFVNPTDDNPTGIQLSLQLTDLTGTAFAGDSLPLRPPSLSAFTFTNSFSRIRSPATKSRWPVSSIRCRCRSRRRPHC